MNIAQQQIQTPNAPVRRYNETTKHQFSKEEQEIFDKILKNRPVSSKYWKAQKDHVIEKTKECFTKMPEKPVIKVLMDILSELPEWLPPRNLIEVTTYVVEEWENLQKKEEKVVMVQK